ncbi:hypothetical protein [Asticcacaulis sp. YBE204]|uniref:hypothetical protein n=1 Tax=Asticcacaulis sp. YBE204 TaxID=1282363 RepID=UPI0003C3FCED|nr:hypothetical protein [Asticcacaulis sp. YBE204]ESQ76543.1 hypothetical protein AEYBE204_19320 [Asticcacaulis sp. YBE204]
MKPILFVAALLSAGLFTACLAMPILAATPPANQTKAFPNADGPFSAALVLVGEASLAEFKKPADQGLQLTLIKTASPGDKIAAKVLFMGFALDEGFGNVTYDIRVLRPDGQVYGTKSKADHKGLLGFKGATMNATNIFNNAATLVLDFEATDPEGVYKIEVVVHDTIGNHHIPLSAEVTLKH